MGNNQIMLIVLIVLASLVALGIAALLYFTFIKRSMLHKKASELIADFETHHAILFGDVSRSITRLKTISDVNITYIDQYSSWEVKFKDVRDSSDANAQSAANSIKDCLDERKYKDLKEFLPDAKSKIDEFKQRVEELKEGLEEVFKIDDEVTAISLSVKERYRSVKQKFNAESSDLSMVSDTFATLFRNIDGYLTNADDQKEKACYLEAKSIYQDKVSVLIDQIDSLLNVLPSICKALGFTLPNKISSLKNRYHELTKEGYPLQHLISKRDLEVMETTIKRLTQSVESLNMRGVSSEIDKLDKGIDSFNLAFDKEVAAREAFEKRSAEVYKEEASINQYYVNLSNSIPNIKNYYLLGADDLEKLDQIGTLINDNVVAKRLLDNYVHSNTPQLYTVLVENMNSLAECCRKSKEAIDSFTDYLRSLKKDYDVASQSVKDYYFRFRDAEIKVRELNMPSLEKAFFAKFKEIYETIDGLNSCLNAAPVDMKKAKSILLQLEEKGENILKDLDSAQKECDLAEKAIVYANRYRSDSADVHAALGQSESLFYSGSFKEALEVAKSAAIVHQDK